MVAGAAAARAGQSAPKLTREDLLDPKNRALAFRSMSELFPYHAIRRAGTISELPRAERRLDVRYQWKGAERTLDDLLARTRTTGFLVIKNGRIVTERYFGGADEHSRFTSWSVGKSFTSTLVGLAIADGKIAGVDRPVTDYLPELKGSGYDGVKIRDILEMSSGVDFTEEYANGRSGVQQMWQRTMVAETERLDDYAKSLGRKEPAGRRFYYRSVDTQVLGWLVRRATGEPLADYLSRKVWQPLGAESDATWLTDKPGPDAMEAAFCCINATLRDYGRFGLLFMNRGKHNGRQIVPATWVAHATAPEEAQDRFGHLERNYPLGYGYQWWLLPGDDRAFTAQGVFFQFIYVDPAAQLVIVKTSAFEDFWDDALEMETYAAFNAIRDALRGS
jgi:CubicO group peptidase (beta-lactamase class C family)